MSLQKPLLALLFLAIASSVSSTTCDNPLHTVYYISNDFDEPQVVPGLKYCKSLQNKETCCSAETINNFQAKTDDLLETLRAEVALRDKSLIRIRNYLLPSLSGKLNTLKGLADQAVTKLQANLDAGGYGNSTFDSKISEVISLASGLSDTAKALTDGISSLTSSFPDYQSARTPCVIEIVKIQAAAWCLTCEPDYASKGVSDSGIAFSDTLVQTLTSACYDYLNDAAAQSAFFSLNLMNNYLQNFTDAFTEVVNGEFYGPILFMAAWDWMVDYNSSLDSTLWPVEFPNDCDGAECNWIATSLFRDGGQLNEELLYLGGALENHRFVSRRLEEVKVNNRMLGTTWSPDSDEAGVTVNFEDNPGKVDSLSAALLKGVMGGLVVLLSVLLI